MWVLSTQSLSLAHSPLPTPHSMFVCRRIIVTAVAQRSLLFSRCTAWSQQAVPTTAGFAAVVAAASTTAVGGFATMASAAPADADAGASDSTRSTTGKSVYDFTVKAPDGSDVSLEKYRGQVLIIVNSASVRWLGGGGVQQRTSNAHMPPLSLSLSLIACSRSEVKPP